MKKLLIGSLLFGASVLGIGHMMIKPDVDFDSTRKYEPTGLQQAFLKAAAKSHYYVALGDTSHDRVEIEAFAFNEKTVRALAEAGKHNYFLEQPPGHQFYFDALQTNTPALNTLITDGKEKFSPPYNNDWLCSAGQRNFVHDIFEKSAKGNKDIRFMGVDTRNGQQNEQMKAMYKEIDTIVGGMSSLEKIQSAAGLAMFVLYYKAYGCVSQSSFELLTDLLPERFANDLEKAFLSGISDDSGTSDFILSQNAPSVIFFGAGHFQGGMLKNTDQKSMRRLLQKDGKSLIVIDIYKDMAHKLEMQSRLQEEIDKNPDQLTFGQQPDAIMYVIPPLEYPDGIEIVNPRLQELYNPLKQTSLAHYMR